VKPDRDPTFTVSSRSILRGKNTHYFNGLTPDREYFAAPNSLLGMSKATTTTPPADGEQPVPAFPPLSPTEAALELGVDLTQRLQPNLRDKVPRRLVSKAEAEARGWSWHYDGGSTCRYGHVAARRTANPNICSDCERVAAGEAQVYPKSRVQKYYTEPRRKSKDASAPVVIAAPAAPPAQVEPTKKEQDFLAALDETRDFDVAAQRTNFSRSQIEARASVNEVFRKALTDLCDRRGIAWTRAPDAGSFPWTAEIEKQFAARYVDTGLLQQARDEMGVSASAYQERLQSSSNFAGLIETATPLARLTLRDRATQAASVGKVDLLKFLEKDIEENSISSMSWQEAQAELSRLLDRFIARGDLQTIFTNKKTGELVDIMNDLVDLSSDQSLRKP
jgi:hypothetical protein